MAFESKGARQITALSSCGNSRFIDITSIPDSETTGKRPVSLPKGRAVMPNMRGILAPVMSASRIPTLLPCRFKAIASKAVTSDLPTPPLPLITAMICLISFSASGLASINSMLMSAPLKSGSAALIPAATNCCTSGVRAVEARVRVILSPTMVILRTRFRSVTLCSTVGTKTLLRAVVICDSVIIGFPS